MSGADREREAQALRARVAVLARAPVAGQAKTRLIPALGAAGAARLAERMLDHATAQAVAAQLGPVTVWAAADASHPAFAAVRARHGVALAVQPPGDLGARMARVFEEAFAGSGADPVACPDAGPGSGANGGACDGPRRVPPLLLIGTDAPALDAPRLRAAAAALVTHPAVFVPALDGGYALVGLRAPPAGRLPALLAALFEDMRWSTPQVMADTRRRLAAAGWEHAELEAVADIDEPADLQHLPPDWAAAALAQR